MTIQHVRDWRVAVDRSHRFAIDELILWIVGRSGDDRVMVRPVAFELHYVPAFASTGDQSEPSMTIPRELAEALFNALAPIMVGCPTGDLAAKVRRLERDLATERGRLDMLIKGIGRLGDAPDRT